MAIFIEKLDELPKRIRDLLGEAQEKMKYAYNAYSNFYVGAAVQSKSGHVYSGTFMENASQGLTICAEAAALLAATSSGDLDIRTLAVVGGNTLEDNSIIVTPCGRCRQLLYESSQLADQDIEIYCANATLSSIVATTIQELLPMPFGPIEIGLESKIRAYKNRIETLVKKTL